jgi:pyruvate dehydrogenase E1 component alpha subunit
MVDKKELIEFETEIGRLYEQGKILAPIHLTKNNESKLRKIFKDYQEGDWVFSTHRSHYHWLLSGRDPEELKKQILEGHSMHIFADKFFSSAIVGGNVSIALGVAWALKMKKSNSKVYCFVGDAASECGIAHECMKYAKRHDLPIKYIIEDNGLCVRAKTNEIWGIERPKSSKIIKYKYNRHYPHAGTGKYVMF